MSFHVGLTGGIASGKSTVSQLFAQAGFTIIDYDLIAREVVAPGSLGLTHIAERFGSEFIDESGNMDRVKMGALVFSDVEALRALEAITHPLILQTAQERVDSARGIVVHDNPLLIEMGGGAVCDVVVVVDALPALQISRMMRDRQMSETEAKQRIANQTDRQTRLAAADIVIENSGTLEELENRVAEVIVDLQQRGLSQ